MMTRAASWHVPIAALAFALAGCAAPPPNDPPDPAATATVAMPIAAHTGRPTPAVDQAGRFSTRHAIYEPATFSDLPGWSDDSLDEAWQSFRQSCVALARRSAWEEVCSRSASIDAGDSAALHEFFERTFSLYRILNTDQSPTGVIAGYFEPLLRASRKFGKPYIFPIYGVPEDLLYLSARSLAAKSRAPDVYARVVGRTVAPVANGSAGPGFYRIDLGGMQPDIRDKKFRVRREGDRIVPYYTRAQIERGSMQGAPILLWAESVRDIETMQVQGSGRIRLPDGSVARLAYAEQNGHPFPAEGTADRSDQFRVRIRTGGATLENAADDAVDRGGIDEFAKGGRQRAKEPRTAGVGAQRGVSGEASTDSAEVDRLVEALSRGKRKSQARSPAPENAPAPAVAVDAKSRAESATAARNERAINDSRVADQIDPSYVFFRVLPDADGGPLGALGVPLTAGRSAAVDPRTAPLGFPLFLETVDPQNMRPPIRRLMMAQDTGGAVRGAVRADIFWGAGHDAARLAAHTKSSGRIWLLLPKGQQVAVQESLLHTRGRGIAVLPAADCLVPDPDMCVEE